MIMKSVNFPGGLGAPNPSQVERSMMHPHAHHMSIPNLTERTLNNSDLAVSSNLDSTYPRKVHTIPTLHRSDLAVSSKLDSTYPHKVHTIAGHPVDRSSLLVPFEHSLFAPHQRPPLAGSILAAAPMNAREISRIASSKFEDSAQTEMQRLASKARAAKLAAEAAALELEAARFQQELDAVKKAQLIMLKYKTSLQRPSGLSHATALAQNGYLSNSNAFLNDATLKVNPKDAVRQDNPFSGYPAVPGIYCMETRNQAPSNETKSTKKRAAPSPCASSSDIHLEGGSISQSKRAKKEALPVRTNKSNHSRKIKASSAEKEPAKPRRPMSAYLLYSICEREHVIANLNATTPVPLPALKPFSEVIKDLPKTGKKKRRHRFVHGKIGFADLSKLMAGRWHVMPEDRKNYYKMLSEMDRKRFDKEVQQQSNATDRE